MAKVAKGLTEQQHKHNIFKQQIFGSQSKRKKHDFNFGEALPYPLWCISVGESLVLPPRWGLEQGDVKGIRLMIRWIMAENEWQDPHEGHAPQFTLWDPPLQFSTNPFWATETEGICDTAVDPTVGPSLLSVCQPTIGTIWDLYCGPI